MGTDFLLDRALALAAKAHQDQVRKGTDIPYISHPYAVGLILQKAGCREEVVAAGIMHDILEDTEVTLDRIRKESERRSQLLLKVARNQDIMSFPGRRGRSIPSFI